MFLKKKIRLITYLGNFFNTPKKNERLKLKTDPIPNAFNSSQLNWI